MVQAGEDVKDEVWKSFIVLLTNAPELHAYAARCLFRALRQHLATAQTSLLATATWYTGECAPGHGFAVREARRSLLLFEGLSSVRFYVCCTSSQLDCS